MKLKEFKEEIYKCSGCGLCQNVCPVYKILKTEAAVSRGKFNLLNAIINENTHFTKNVLESMDLCLHCGACSKFCPSGIDAQKIVETAKYDMFTNGIYNFRKVFIAKIFANKFLMKNMQKLLNIAKKLKILEILGIFGCKKNKLVRAFLKENIKQINIKSDIQKTVKILYFEGCINKYINSSSKNSIEKILDKTNVEIINADFNCCGLPLKSAGDFESFKKVAKENLNKIDMDFDYMVFDCASCQNTFMNYEKFLDGEDKEKALELSSKIISIYELLAIINYEPKGDWKHNKITLHYPCHTRGTKEKDFITELVNKIPNCDFVEMDEADSCCGAAGSFFATNPKISKQISKNKAQNIINSGANVVLTACPSCFIGLKQGLIEENSTAEVMQIVEFFARNEN